MASWWGTSWQLARPFEGATKLSCSVDAARLGKRQRFLAALAMSNNKAARAPPQAPDLNKPMCNYSLPASTHCMEPPFPRAAQTPKGEVEKHRKLR